MPPPPRGGGVRVHPVCGGSRRGLQRWVDAAVAGPERQPGGERLVGYDVPLGDQRGVAGEPGTNLAGSSEEAAGPLPQRIARGDARKSAVRARVGQQFTQQKEPMGLLMRTISLERARMKIGLANLAYNFQRLVFHERRTVVACLCLGTVHRGRADPDSRLASSPQNSDPAGFAPWAAPMVPSAPPSTGT